MPIGSSGPHVKELQEKLIRLGYPLPKWGADGDLGWETLGAVTQLMASRGRPRDPDPNIVSDAELFAVDEMIAKLDTPDVVAQPSKLIDRRAYAKKNYDYGQRMMNDIWGATAHQTACTLSVSKDKARCDGVGAHFVIMRGDCGGYYGDGDIIWLHDEWRTIVHGNEFNTKCWGFEVDGLLAGIKGNMNTVWDDPSTPWREKPNLLTPGQATSIIELVSWRWQELKKLGANNLRVLNTHRQSSASRRNDPGSEIMEQAIIPLWKMLGIDDGGPGSLAAGSDGGYPNPREWIPNDPERLPYGYFDPPRYGK